MSLEHSPIRSGGDAALRPLLVSVPEALRLTSLGRTKFYELVADGTFETRKAGAKTLVVYRSLERYAHGESEGE